MNTAYIIIIVLIVVILLLLLCSYFLWWQKPKKQIEKTKGSSNVNIHGYVGIPVYLNTTVETYLAVIYNDNETVDLIVKTGGLSEKGNEYVFNQEMLTIDRTYDEFYSHLSNIKKLSRIIHKQLFWHHVCIFNSFGEFQNVRNYNNDDIKAGSSSLSGLLEIIGHYITLDMLYKYCEEQIILISDNNFDKIEYKDGKGLYESVASMIKGGTNKLKKASFIQNIKQFSSVDNNLEFYIARFKNTENIKGKIDDIIESIISRSNSVLKKLFEIDTIDGINDEESFSEFNKIKLLFNITSDEKLINHICAKSRPRNTNHDTFMSLIQTAKQIPDQQLELKTYATDVSIIRTTIEDAYPSLDENIRKFHNIENDDSINQLIAESKDVTRYDDKLEGRPENNVDLIMRLQTLYDSLVSEQLGTTYETLYKSEEILCYVIYYMISNITQGNYIDDNVLSALTNSLYEMQDSGSINRYYLTDCFDKLIYGYILFTNIQNDEYKDIIMNLLSRAIHSESYDDYIDIFSLIIDTNETRINRYIEKSFDILGWFIESLKSISGANENIVNKSVDGSLLQTAKQNLSTINDFANAAMKLMKLRLGNLEEPVTVFEDRHIFINEYDEDIVGYFTDLLFKYIYIKRYTKENEEQEEEDVNQLEDFVIGRVDNQLSSLFSFINQPTTTEDEIKQSLHIFIGLLDMVINIIDNCCSDIDNECLDKLLAYIDSHYEAFISEDFEYNDVNYDTYIDRINNIVTLYYMNNFDGILYNTETILSLDNQFDSLLDSFIQSHKFIEFFNIVFSYYTEHYENPTPEDKFIENVNEILSFIESHDNAYVYNPILAYLEVYTDCLSNLPNYINIYNIIICVHNIMTQIVEPESRTPDTMRNIILDTQRQGFIILDIPEGFAQPMILRNKRSILNSCLFILEKYAGYKGIYNDVNNIITDVINYSDNHAFISQTINNFMIAFKSVFYYMLVNGIENTRIMIRQAGEEFYDQCNNYFKEFKNKTPNLYPNIKSLFEDALKEPEQPMQPIQEQ